VCSILQLVCNLLKASFLQRWREKSSTALIFNSIIITIYLSILFPSLLQSVYLSLFLLRLMSLVFSVCFSLFLSSVDIHSVCYLCFSPSFVYYIFSPLFMCLFFFLRTSQSYFCISLSFSLLFVHVCFLSFVSRLSFSILLECFIFIRLYFYLLSITAVIIIQSQNHNLRCCLVAHVSKF